MSSSLTTICRLLPLYEYQVSKSRVERWISDGNFRPLDEPEQGRARLWSLPDLMRLLVFIRLVDSGCKIEVGRAIGALHGFKADAAFLVVSAIRGRLHRPAGDKASLSPDWQRALDRMGDSDQYIARVCSRTRALDALADNHVLAVHIVMLDVVEKEAHEIMERAERSPEESE
jgi:hypothetical protein